MEFALEAIPVVDQIVRELPLPDPLKTIKPVSSGYAGGAKYLHEGMFIKVARDTRNLVCAFFSLGSVFPSWRYIAYIVWCC